MAIFDAGVPTRVVLESTLLVSGLQLSLRGRGGNLSEQKHNTLVHTRTLAIADHESYPQAVVVLGLFDHCVKANVRELRMGGVLVCGSGEKTTGTEANEMQKKEGPVGYRRGAGEMKSEDGVKKKMDYLWIRIRSRERLSNFFFSQGQRSSTVWYCTAQGSKLPGPRFEQRLVARSQRQQRDSLVQSRQNWLIRAFQMRRCSCSGGFDASSSVSLARASSFHRLRSISLGFSTFRCVLLVAE